MSRPLKMRALGPSTSRLASSGQQLGASRWHNFCSPTSFLTHLNGVAQVYFHLVGSCPLALFPSAAWLENRLGSSTPQVLFGHRDFGHGNKLGGSGFLCFPDKPETDSLLSAERAELLTCGDLGVSVVGNRTPKHQPKMR